MLKPALLSLAVTLLFAPAAPPEAPAAAAPASPPLAAPGLPPVPPPAPLPIAHHDEPLGTIQFTLSHRQNDGRAQFSLTSDRRGSWNSSGPQEWDHFVGITRADLDRNPPANVRFTVTRAAGVLSCTGFAGGSAAAGTCQFASDQRFVSELSRRGIARPSERELFFIALSDFQLATLDELARQNYRTPSRDELMALAIHDITAEYARDIARSGYRLDEADELVAFRIHGVTSAWIADMARLGAPFANLPASDVLQLSIHEVDPSFVREMRALGFNVGPDGMVAMRIHGVTREYINEMAQVGYRDLSAETLIAFRVHEVTAEFVRRLNAAGYSNLSADELVHMRIAGVTPDYARDMERARVRTRTHN